MRLSDQTALFSLHGIPMVGNLATGAFIGLTASGDRLCREMSVRDVAKDEVSPECVVLVEHLERGGYLASAPAAVRSLGSAYLHVTQRCNLSCKFCYSEDEKRNILPDPPLKSLRVAIDFLASLGCGRLVVSGGEPFLRQDLPDIVSRAKACGIREVVILTNGLLVGEKDLDALKGLVSCLGIAFDGPNADSVAHLRGKQRFDSLITTAREARRRGIPVRVLPTLHAKNIADMDAYQELANDLGATLGFSLLTAPCGQLGDLALTEEQLTALGTSSVERGMPDSGDMGELGATLCARSSCGAGVTTLSVAADGTVYPCHMLHDGSLAMGNAFVDSAEKILGSRVAQACRELDVRNIEHCSGCDSRFLCGGGCRARALMDTGKLDGVDPYCALPRSYYEQIGILLAQRYTPKGGD